MSENNYTVAVNSNVYYQGHYWNDYELVRKHLNTRISGSENTNWHQHFINNFYSKKFKKALFLNCGNGWVERELFKTGLFEEAIGIDYSQSLIDEAIRLADCDNLPFSYYQLDINTGLTFEKEFDLVVNHASCHHIAFLDKVLRSVNRAMTPDGYFINYDYVGPHRNQYPYFQWNEVHLLNERIVPKLRQNLSYPHLPTMLNTDPTEAIHSELILEYTYRYFDIKEHKRLGGALAYPILTFNKNLQNSDPMIQDEIIQFIMNEDRIFTEKYPYLSMFDYFIGTPNKEVLKDFSLLSSFEAEENSREYNASLNSGIYHISSLLQNLYLELEELRCNNTHMLSDLHKIQNLLANRK